MALRLQDEFVPEPDDGNPEIRKLREVLETGEPVDQHAALGKLVGLRAESALTACLLSKNPLAAHLATGGLWECWLNEQGPIPRREMEKGIRRMNDRNLEGALEVFDRLAQKFPGWAEAHNKKATVLYLLGSTRLSYKICQLVVELKPHHFGAWNGMALCAAQMEKWQAALDAATEALRIQPGSQATVDLSRLAEAKLTEDG
jgi:tetratricopeptide (TPR) repeat protein